MNLLEVDFYKKVKEQANNKDYEIIVKELEVGAPGERALASHYVDYANKQIEISLPSSHDEMVELFIHELIHAELFLKDYPRILRSPEFEYNEIDEIMAEEIENLAQHYLLYPRMVELGYKHQKENERFLRKVLPRTKRISNGPNVILDGFTILEADYRDYEEFKAFETDIASKNSAGYGFYRRVKRIYSRITDQGGMRKAIIKIMNEVEKWAKTAGVNLNYKMKFIVPPVSTKYEKEQICSKFYEVVTYKGFNHYYIIDKRDRQTVQVVNGQTHTLQGLENSLNSLTVKDFF